MKPVKGAANFTVTQDDGTPTFHLYDDIGPSWMGMISAEEIVSELAKVATAPAVKVRINSPGGDVFEASAIYNALCRHGGDINVEIDGVAASAASVIAMAGDTITMAQNALMMVHNAWTVTAGNKDDHVQAAATLAKVDQNICNTYCARTGQTTADVQAMMDAETWMTAQDALAKGFCTAIGQPLNTASACIPAGRFKNTPRHLLTPAPTASADATIALAHPPVEPVPPPAPATPPAAGDAPKRLDLMRARANLIRHQLNL